MMDRSVSVCVSNKLLNEADKKLLERPLHQQQLKFHFTKSQRKSGGILPYFAVLISLGIPTQRKSTAKRFCSMIERKQSWSVNWDVFITQGEEDHLKCSLKCISTCIRWKKSTSPWLHLVLDPYSTWSSHHRHCTAACIWLPTDCSHFCLASLHRLLLCADYPDRSGAIDYHHLHVLTMILLCLEQPESQLCPGWRHDWHPTLKRHLFVRQRCHRFPCLEPCGILQITTNTIYINSLRNSFHGIFTCPATVLQTCYNSYYKNLQAACE